MNLTEHSLTFIFIYAMKTKTKPILFEIYMKFPCKLSGYRIIEMTQKKRFNEILKILKEFKYEIMKEKYTNKVTNRFCTFK